MSSFAGQGQDHGSTQTLINMTITGSADWTSASVIAGSFTGIYDSNKKSSVVFIPQADFDSLKGQLAGGNQVSVTLQATCSTTTTIWPVTQFCYSGKCVCKTAKLDSAAPASGVSATGAVVSAAAGTK